jgi:hypothetical protein
VEAYKIILKESGSVRRAEELSRKMRAQIGNVARTSGSRPAHQVSENIDIMRQTIEDALGGHPSAQVKLSRSRAETRINIILKGDLDDTEDRLQRLFKGITSQP